MPGETDEGNPIIWLIHKMLGWIDCPALIFLHCSGCQPR